MPRLADYIDRPATGEAGVPSFAPASPLAEEVFTFPDQSQPTVRETVGRMVKEMVVPSEAGYESAEELDQMYAQAEQSEAPNEIVPKSRISAAFDSGAKLNMPKPKDEPVDPNLRRPVAKSTRRSPGGRPAGSDEFTDLFAAGMITLIAFTLGDDFQPTEEEAKDLARPLGNIIARRIDLAKKLGQDANDVVAFAVALMAYGVRVGPIAADRVRESYRDRQHRSRTNRLAEPPNRGGTDSMVPGSDAGTSPEFGQTRNPIDAITQARDAQFGFLDRDLGGAANGRSAVDNVG